jgi:hypothetical protein
MTPATALTAVISRLNAAGLKQVRSPLGVMNASSQRIEGCFAVKPSGVRPSSSPGRGRPIVAGLRVDSTFDIEISHQIKPSLGLEAPSQALTDLAMAWAAISENGTTLTTEGAIKINGARNTYEGGGAFYVTRFELVVTYEIDLS